MSSPRHTGFRRRFEGAQHRALRWRTRELALQASLEMEAIMPLLFERGLNTDPVLSDACGVA